MNIRIFPNKTNTISQKYPDYNYGRDAQLTVSSVYYKSHINDAYTNKYINRALIEFDFTDVASTILSNSASITASLVLFDNTEFRSHKNNEPFIIEAYAISQSWTEGIGYEDMYLENMNPSLLINADKTSSWNFRDIYNNDWGSGPSGSTTSTTGGCWYEAISTSVSAYNFEHNIFDIKDMLLYWLNGEIDNNGVIIKLSDFYETSNSNYSVTGINYHKQYFSRHTHTIFSPYIEIIYDDAIQDDRNSFYRGRTQNILMYNFCDEKLENIDGTNCFPGTVSIYNSQTSTTSSLVASGLSASWLKTGIYKLEYNYSGTSSTLYDHWIVDPTASATGYIVDSITGIINVYSNRLLSSNYHDSNIIWNISFENIEESYLHGSIVNLRVKFYNKFFGKQTLTGFSDSQVSMLKVMKDAYIQIIEYQTGYVALPKTKLNYDEYGNWVTFDTAYFPIQKRYIPILYYYDNSEMVRKVYKQFSFMVI
jgi:hypothetical protein